MDLHSVLVSISICLVEHYSSGLPVLALVLYPGCILVSPSIHSMALKDDSLFAQVMSVFGVGTDLEEASF